MFSNKSTIIESTVNKIYNFLPFIVRNYKKVFKKQSTDNNIKKVPKHNIKKRTEKKYLSKLDFKLIIFS